MSGILGRSLARCPVDGCDVDLAAIIEAVPPAPIRVSADLGEALLEAGREGAKARDAALRAHLETHDVLDWMRTVRRLEQELYNAGPTGVRPHARRSVFDTSDLEAYWMSRNERY